MISTVEPGLPGAAPGSAGVPPACGPEARVPGKANDHDQSSAAVQKPAGSAGVPPAWTIVGLRRVVHCGPPARAGGTPALSGTRPAAFIALMPCRPAAKSR